MFVTLRCESQPRPLAFTVKELKEALVGVCRGHHRGSFYRIMINYQDFSYNGSKITFSKSQHANMVNANDMEKAFKGKTVRQWFDNASTQEFVHALASMRGYDVDVEVEKRTSLTIKQLSEKYPKLIYMKRGGNPTKVEQGTWLHQDLAIEFARWLSPMFAIWCNDRIVELLTTGKTELNTAAPSRAWTPEMEAKIQMADAYIESDTPCSLRGIAQQIMLTSGKKITRSQLVSWLYDNGYLQKDPNIKYCPTQWAIEMGYFMIKVGRRQIRKDRTPRNGSDKGVPTPLGAMHLINLLSHCMPVLRERRRSSIS